jgi:hypothetical protein
MSDQPTKSSGFGIGEAGKLPASTPMDELEAERLQPASRGKMVRCDCGHTVPSILVMNASLGTSCPDCYDEMSD